jgi:gliding motility-associated-like protein
VKRLLLFILFVILCISQTFATHERAAEITYRSISNNSLQYEIKLVTYTYTPSPADRPQLEIVWGDGTSSMVQRTSKTNLAGNISKNEYVTIHTFPGDGVYKISMEDPNRNYGVINIPNSVNVPIYVETMLVISPFINPKNNSPQLLNPPLDMGCVGVSFLHNPGAYDPDGDSISYKLVKCKGAQGLDIPGYNYPQASNFVSINPITGDFIWENPVIQGEYNVAILIEEWRNGIRIGYITRDMQIIIASCTNRPPVIDPIPDTCIEAGDTLVFNVHASDPDNNMVTLTATGGPLILSYFPAIFFPATGMPDVNAPFYWETKCEHIRKSPYQVSFKAQDNGTPVKLTSYKNMFIKVVGPAPKNLTASANGNTIELNWNKSSCSNAVGYKIYRRNGYYGYFHGYCETGVPAYTGYSLIKTIPTINDTSFIDNNNGSGLIHGIDYCYIAIAYYPDGAESYASLEACAELKRDVPIITNVSVLTTNSSNGKMFVAWSKPTELDTNQIQGPYKYLIYRSPDLNGSNFSLIDSLSGMKDTIYTDSTINTVSNPYNYRIDFYNDSIGNRFKIGSTHLASSVYLKLLPADKKITLSWEFNVPWNNNAYVIYRKNNTTSIFDSIGWSTTPIFIDKGLTNEISYCYYVKSIGSYSITNIVNPIINYSQEACGIPIDQEPPCPPILTVTPDCQTVTNTLNWITTDSCAYDILKYNIWYSPTISGNLSVLSVINNPVIKQFIHNNIISIAGCYAINAIDSNNNTGSLSNVVCIDIDSCSLYELPNIFTPNGDGFNDVFKPYPYHFVEKIAIKIYNRWGNVVFETNNPDINWNGKEKSTDKDCSDGVYFYICDVYELRLKGEIVRQIHGSVTLLR